MSENYKTQGVSLSVLKSLGWILQGILWDATVEPLAKTTGAALGYLSVNLVAFPTVVLVKEGVATTQLAVQVTVDTAKTGYDIVAPTAIAALAGLYGVADLAVSQPVAGTTAVAGTVLPAIQEKDCPSSPVKRSRAEDTSPGRRSGNRLRRR